jgi:NAD(P)-dependent dehydrogenase (short-subunit alcohol dehydrogenase family)
MQLQGQTALVTGAASGLGEATARELARLGAKVAVLDINEAQAETVASAIRAEFGEDRAIALRCDITQTDSVQAALDASERALGAARILMNVAGIGSAKRVVQRDGTAAPSTSSARTTSAVCLRQPAASWRRWRTASVA